MAEKRKYYHAKMWAKLSIKSSYYRMRPLKDVIDLNVERAFGDRLLHAVKSCVVNRKLMAYWRSRSSKIFPFF